MNKIALDLEEVLADTIQEVCRSTDAVEYSDFNSWDIKPGYTWQVYAGVSDALWRHDPLAIPPVEPFITEHVDSLYDETERLDIVTARLHVDHQIESWLSHHNIQYDNLISIRKPKYEVNYDLFIDDNPEMDGECRLLLRDHPHNSHIEDEKSKMTDRINSLEEATGFVK